MSNLVFVDSSFWVTYRDEDDSRRPAAQQILEKLFRDKVTFVTILPVICEIHAKFSRHSKRRDLVLRDFFDNPVVRIEDVSTGDQKEAVKLLQANRDKTYSLCDALSFVIMRRLHIKRAASYDVHFRQFGEFEIIC